MQLVRPHVSLTVVRICRLRHDEGAAVRADSQAAGTSAAVGRRRQSVADKAPGRTGEFEDTVGVSVGDEDVA